MAKEDMVQARVSAGLKERLARKIRVENIVESEGVRRAIEAYVKEGTEIAAVKQAVREVLKEQL